MRAIATALSFSSRHPYCPFLPAVRTACPDQSVDVPSLHGFDALGLDGVGRPCWLAGWPSLRRPSRRTCGWQSASSSDPGAYNVPECRRRQALGFIQEKGRAGVIDVRFRNMTGRRCDAISIAFDAVAVEILLGQPHANLALELLYSAVTARRSSRLGAPSPTRCAGRGFSDHWFPEQSVRVVGPYFGAMDLPSLVRPGEELLLAMEKHKQPDRWRGIRHRQRRASKPIPSSAQRMATGLPLFATLS